MNGMKRLERINYIPVISSSVTIVDSLYVFRHMSGEQKKGAPHRQIGIRARADDIESTFWSNDNCLEQYVQ